MCELIKCIFICSDYCSDYRNILEFVGFNKCDEM